MFVFDQPIKFEWDKGNINKNLKKHQVSNLEAEQVFFDPKKKIFSDPIHSSQEKRYLLLGKTKNKRLLFVAFTQRNKKIRIISARDINKKEINLYEKST